ncbi:MAG TPA: nuclear transport factor 2 family protein [Gammaproteobacteria bacterium]|nr:nuclear transport factor 2 family protein [Gammaproteobacteria bacterium]
MKLLAGAFALLLVTSVIQAAEPVVAANPADQAKMLQSSDPQLAANKKLVYDMWRSFLTARHIEAADQYLAPEYHQHNPNADTGREGVKAYFKALNLQPIPVPDTIPGLISITAERDLVSLAFVRTLKDKDGKEYTTTGFDMFRVANGKIVEHWDIATKP